MPITTFVVRDEYFDNPIYSHNGVVRGVVYTVREDDGAGVYFADDTGATRYLSYKNIRAVEHAVQIPDAPAPQSDAVNHPSHYGGDTTYEAIKVIEAWGLNFNTGNAAKYISRAGKKSAEMVEDLKKSVWYLNREITNLEKAK